jgi:hypothetical protein
MAQSTTKKPAARRSATTARPAREDAKGTPEQASGEAASRFIDQLILDLGDWRGETLARMRALILEADPEIVEELKWRGTPVWSHNGIVCTGETYKKVVKLTFAKGAHIADPSKLFNSSLEGNTRRAIDIQEGEQVDATAFKALLKAAVAENAKSAKSAPKSKSAGTSKPAASEAKPAKARRSEKVAVALLSGGNPQIAKGDGDAPVQAYIAAMPGWKRALGKRLDSLIERTVPNVRKAVKWNSPFYGVEGKGWFLSFHVFTRFVKVTFFNGTSLQPVPPGGTPKSQETRWIDLHEGDFDEEQLASWVKQGAAMPGWDPAKKS